MKHLYSAALVMVFVFAACQQQKQAVYVYRSMIPAPSLANSLYDTPTEQPVVIYLPPSYYTSKNQYPVVYFLPGFTTDVTEMIDGTFQGLHIRTVMDSLIVAGEIREMIFVVVNGRNFLGGSFYVNSPVTGNWEDYIINDVVHFVDEHYRTVANASARGISGSSMGGFGAVNLGMLHPDVFSAVYSLSPGLFDECGLDDQGMFIPEDKIFQYLSKQETFAALPEANAMELFQTFIADLYNARSVSHYFWAFSYAYGAAFAPNPERGVPYIDYPFARYGDSLQMDPAIMQRYERGFGAQAEKLLAYRDNFLKLKGLVIDIGRNDYYQWIVRGSRYFAELLQKTGIPHQLLVHDGGHEDRLRERVEKHLLPFFSECLSRE